MRFVTISFLLQNGALAEAIGIWKRNFDKEFEGVEECPICYSVIHTTNHGLPRLACRTCKHKFHSACLYKWFSTSHKSSCPLCQSPFWDYTWNVEIYQFCSLELSSTETISVQDVNMLIHENQYNVWRSMHDEGNAKIPMAHET